ncbi:MAG: type II toxin-antitoxin system RelE family toxin [Micromonosporaceae bacterium]
MSRPDDAKPYRVIYSRAAARALSERLPEPAAFAAHEFCQGPLASDPRRVGHQLRPPFVGQWSARRGEYRVRYQIDEDDHAVHVLDVDHRRDVYRLR